MFKDIVELHGELVAREEKNFISRYFFDCVPYIFSDDLEIWIKWKSELGRRIEVDARNIVLTGSAAIRFSLNPRKKFKEYDESSDIDCGIISPHHFDIAWRHLRQKRSEWLSLPARVKSAITSHRENHIFSGVIATDQILPILPFGSDWTNALQEMSRMPPTVGRDVKVRIFKDFDALRGYQAVGVRDARSRAISEGVSQDEQDIPTEDE